MKSIHNSFLVEKFIRGHIFLIIPIPKDLGSPSLSISLKLKSCLISFPKFINFSAFIQFRQYIHLNVDL